MESLPKVWASWTWTLVGKIVRANLSRRADVRAPVAQVSPEDWGLVSAVGGRGGTALRMYSEVMGMKTSSIGGGRLS